jgi:hypothetical protein
VWSITVVASTYASLKHIHYFMLSLDFVHSFVHRAISNQSRPCPLFHSFYADGKEFKWYSTTWKTVGDARKLQSKAQSRTYVTGPDNNLSIAITHPTARIWYPADRAVVENSTTGQWLVRWHRSVPSIVTTAMNGSRQKSEMSTESPM